MIKLIPITDAKVGMVISYVKNEAQSVWREVASVLITSEFVYVRYKVTAAQELEGKISATVFDRNCHVWQKD